MFQFPDGNYFYLDFTKAKVKFTFTDIDTFQFPDGNYFYLDV